MSEEKISQLTLEKIKEKAIKPKSKFYFQLKNYLIWGFSILFLILSSLALAVIIYMLVNNDWEIFQSINRSFSGFIFTTLPRFWLIFLGASIILTYLNIKQTKKGYRLTLIKIITVSILVSILIGAIFYYLGLGQTIDEVLNERSPLYRNYLNQRNRIWTQPESGLLMGMITEIKNENNFSLIDINNKKWNIQASDNVFMGPLNLQLGMRIKILGQVINGNNFAATRIMLAFPPSSPFKFNKRFQGPSPRMPVPGILKFQ